MSGQKAIELILLRQLAGYLAMPILIASQEGELLFYNAPAEAVLGRRFAETGEMPLEEWMRHVHLFAEDGSLIPPAQRPLPTALHEHRPVHRRLLVQGFDGRSHRVESTVMPLEGQSGRQLGAAIIFWELDEA